MPKTPGSNRLLVCSTGTPEIVVRNVARRTTHRRLAQERNHETRTTHAPKAHSARQIPSIRNLDALGLGSSSVPFARRARYGCTARVTVVPRVCGGEVDALVGQRCCPAATNRENGKRNFIDARSQNRKRRLALLLRRTEVIAHTIPTTAVVCQRWLATAGKERVLSKENVVIACLPSRACGAPSLLP